MKQEIQIIRLPLPFRTGFVNCYLLETASGFVLIDTGSSRNREELVKELERAGCQPGQLKLILITHGDFDHTGNAAYLRQVFGGKIAMHAGDAGMIERGDMFVNRKKPNFLVRMLAPLFIPLGRADRFTPDLLFKAEGELSDFDLDARVISIPGHSKGSIGILTAYGELFCGDLLENNKKPALNSLLDDVTEARDSLEKLGSLGVETVFPGHGMPFKMHQLRPG